MLPFWSNALIRVFSWTIVLREGGLLDRLVRLFLPDAGVSGLLYSYPAIVIGLVHSFIPYIILTCYLSLQAIDGSLLDAARSLGASRLTTFRRITFPSACPAFSSAPC